LEAFHANSRHNCVAIWAGAIAQGIQQAVSCIAFNAIIGIYGIAVFASSRAALASGKKEIISSGAGLIALIG